MAKETYRATTLSSFVPYWHARENGTERPVRLLTSDRPYPAVPCNGRVVLVRYGVRCIDVSTARTYVLRITYFSL